MSRLKSKGKKQERVKMAQNYVAMRRQLKKDKKDFKRSDKYTPELDEKISKANTIKKFDRLKKGLGE